MWQTLRLIAGRIIWTLRQPPYHEAPVKFMFRVLRYTWNQLMAGEANTIEFTACGGRLFVTPTKNHSASIAAIFDERDLNIVRFWPRVLQAGGTFLDVGANIGLYSISASRFVGSTGRVIGFEAHPIIYEYLQSNIARNEIHNITAENVAVGAENGQVRIAFCETNAGQTHVATGSERGVSVPLVSLDYYCAQNRIDHIDYLKLDIEGYEAQVLRGGAAIISASESILIQTEYVPQHLGRYGSPTELVALLTAWGFAPHTITWSDGIARPLPSFDRYRGEIVWSRRNLIYATADGPHSRWAV